MMRTQLLYLTIAGLFASQILFAQDEGSGEPMGIRVDEKNTFALPVDQLDICPWAPGFTVSFTLDFSKLEKDTTTSLLALRSREWDGTDKADRGTLWVDYTDKAGKRTLVFGVRTFENVLKHSYAMEAADTLKEEIAEKHNVTLVLSRPLIYTEAYAEDIALREKDACIYLDGVFIKRFSLDLDLWWRETSYFLVGSALSDALPYEGTLYDFKYFDWPLLGSEIAKQTFASNQDESAFSDSHLVGHWDFMGGNFANLSIGTDKALRADIVDYASDSLAVLPTERPNKYQPQLESGVENKYHYCGEGDDAYYIENTSYDTWNEGDSIYAVSEDFALFTNLSQGGDFSKLYIYSDKVAYDLDWEVGDAADGTFVADVYHCDGRKNIVLEAISESRWMYDAAGLLGDKPYEETLVGDGFRLQRRIIEGIGVIASNFFYLGTRRDSYGELLRSVERNGELYYKNPLIYDDIAATTFGWWVGIEHILGDDFSYTIVPSVVTDQLTVSRTDGGEVDLSSARIHATHGGVVSPASVSGNVMGVGNLPRGVYLLVLTDAEGAHVMKFVKK